jgi:type IV pilus assembly protein PilM
MTQDFVDYLEKNMPSDITIQSFNVASGAITVNGTAGSKSSVAKFIQELQKNSSVLNVDAPTITETKDNAGTIEVTFSLSCTFVGGTSNTTDMKSSNTSNSTKNSSTKSSTTK